MSCWSPKQLLAQLQLIKTHYLSPGEALCLHRAPQEHRLQGVERAGGRAGERARSRAGQAACAKEGGGRPGRQTGQEGLGQLGLELV